MAVWWCCCCSNRAAAILVGVIELALALLLLAQIVIIRSPDELIKDNTWDGWPEGDERVRSLQETIVRWCDTIRIAQWVFAIIGILSPLSLLIGMCTYNSCLPIAWLVVNGLALCLHAFVVVVVALFYVVFANDSDSADGAASTLTAEQEALVKEFFDKGQKYIALAVVILVALFAAKIWFMAIVLGARNELLKIEADEEAAIERHQYRAKPAPGTATAVEPATSAVAVAAVTARGVAEVNEDASTSDDSGVDDAVTQENTAANGDRYVL